MTGEQKSLEERLKGAEVARLEAEIKKINEERAKVKLERQELQKNLGLPWFKRKQFYQGAIAAIVAIPLFWFYVKEFALPLIQAENAKLSLQNEQTRSELSAAQKNFQKELVALQAEKDSLAKKQIELAINFDQVKKERDGLANAYAKLSEKTQIAPAEREAFRKASEKLKGSLLSYQDVDSLIKTKYKDIFQSSEKDAEKWAVDFLRNLPQKRAEIDSLSASVSELSNKYRLQWRPLYDYVLAQFDARIVRLQKENKEIQMTKRDFDVIINIDSSKYKVPIVRVVKFPGDNSINIKVEPGQLQSGVLLRGAQLNFIENLNQNVDYVFSVDCQDNLFQLNPRNKRYKSIDIRTTKDPLSDENFRKVIAEGLNQLIASLYLSE